MGTTEYKLPIKQIVLKVPPNIIKQQLLNNVEGLVY